jgi:hypothetical protein
MSEHGACPVLEGQKVRVTITLLPCTFVVANCDPALCKSRTNTTPDCFVAYNSGRQICGPGRLRDLGTLVHRRETRKRSTPSGLCPLPISRRTNPKRIRDALWPPSKIAGPTRPRSVRPCTTMTVPRNCFGEILEWKIHRSPSTRMRATSGDSRSATL